MHILEEYDSLTMQVLIKSCMCLWVWLSNVIFPCTIERDLKPERKIETVFSKVMLGAQGKRGHLLTQSIKRSRVLVAWLKWRVGSAESVPAQVTN